jgi:AcrR family transcriptional regulator
MQASVKMRKNAKQARSRQSVEAILVATTQLLETSDVDSISTNHIADRAGVSIGTLYQYFPNKTAIFLAIAQRDIERRVRLVADTISQAQVRMYGVPIRELIRAIIASFTDSGKNAPLIRVLLATRGNGHRSELPVDAIAALLAQSYRDQDRMRPMTEVSSFVLTRSVLWTILNATLDAPHLLERQEFEDELVLLTRSLLFSA